MIKMADEISMDRLMAAARNLFDVEEDMARFGTQEPGEEIDRTSAMIVQEKNDCLRRIEEGITTFEKLPQEVIDQVALSAAGDANDSIAARALEDLLAIDEGQPEEVKMAVGNALRVAEQHENTIMLRRIDIIKEELGIERLDVGTIEEPTRKVEKPPESRLIGARK
jgi:hypothetical protein